MKIAQFIPINIAGLSGGMERVYVNMANMLAVRGHEVVCYYFGKNGSPFYPLNAAVPLVNGKGPLSARLRLGGANSLVSVL